MPPTYPTGAWRFRSYREHLADRFGDRRIRKLCLQAGFSCPNLDGTVGFGGCAYCDNRGFSPGLASAGDLLAQWDRGRDALRRRHRRIDGFIAYFQSFSNTHAPLERLQALYGPLPGMLPECVGVSVGTRPDCLPEEALDLLEDLGRRTFLTLEMGLQSDRDAVLRRINRGHSAMCFHDAIRRASGRGFELCVHVILGLPGEGDDAPERMGDLLADLPVQSVKVHNLHIMHGTAMAPAFRRGELPVPSREEYLGLAARLLMRLRPDQAVQRVLADAPDRLLASGGWCHDKQGFLADLARRLGDATASAVG